MAAVVDEKILCMHGGLSPEITSMEQIKRIVRPTDVPDTGLLCDLLWADPEKDITGRKHEHGSERGRVQANMGDPSQQERVLAPIIQERVHWQHGSTLACTIG